MLQGTRTASAVDASADPLARTSGVNIWRFLKVYDERSARTSIRFIGDDITIFNNAIPRAKLSMTMTIRRGDEVGAPQ